LGLGRTYQSAQLFDTHTVTNSLLSARGAARRGIAGWLRTPGSAEDRHAISDLLELLELTEVAHALPSELTNLQQQKLAIGMALATGSRLLLLDEPSGGLIETEVKQLGAFIHRLRDAGKTIVVIDHKMRLMMRLCDRIMVMTAGEELTVGTPNAIAADPNVQGAYLGRKTATLITSGQGGDHAG
jgi:branched-chain amino acid transport system ATP-binding protein